MVTEGCGVAFDYLIRQVTIGKMGSEGPDSGFAMADSSAQSEPWGKYRTHRLEQRRSVLLLMSCGSRFVDNGKRILLILGSSGSASAAGRRLCSLDSTHGSDSSNLRRISKTFARITGGDGHESRCGKGVDR